ncbi:ORF066L [Rock bream iridovirus]|uniref:ORF066L n=1 Tax=Rock bream iridovirus TaxID=263891 RepID=Q5YF21_ISKNV|nr:ORF066L [Rock bream iridovirus]
MSRLCSKMTAHSACIVTRCGKKHVFHLSCHSVHMDISSTYGHLFRVRRPCVVCIMTAVICAHLTRPFEYGHMHAH